MSNISDPVFNPSCPNGGQYYACGNGAKFVGCCASDPCNDAGCSAGNLRAMSFDPSYYGTPQMPDQQCSIAGQQWWSCAKTDPPFLGCCTINPCTSGCPQANLIQGTLSSVASIANAYDPQPPLQSSSTTTSNLTAIESSSASSTNSSSNVSTGAIIGIAIGGSVLVFFVIALIWWWSRRLQHSRREHSVLNPVLHPALHNEKRSSYQDTLSDPSYSAQGTPLPAYGFRSDQHTQPHRQRTVHEADPANQIRQSPGFLSPSTSYSFSPGMSDVGSPSYYPQQPSELVGDSNIPSQPQQQQLRGLGLQRLSNNSHAPAELGHSERGADDAQEGEQRW